LGIAGIGSAWLINQFQQPERASTLGIEAVPAAPLKPTPFPRLSPLTFNAVTVDETGRIINRKQHQARYFTENLGQGISLEMVQLPAGKLMMGTAPTDEFVYQIEMQQPQHSVKVPSFFIGRFVVTQAQWQAVMGNNPSEHKGKNLPVELVSWHDAQKFCQKLGQKAGRKYRLPSEAEWEYACRAGTITAFYLGPTITANLTNYDAYSFGSDPEGLFRDHATPVGTFPANAFGLHDMHGNVEEWCEDFWHEDYKGAPTDGSAWVTPSLLAPTSRMTRGGSFSSSEATCRSAYRNAYSAETTYPFVGFRA
jgi:formylglycine-generating enzyme required for sulfatase activity